MNKFQRTCFKKDKIKYKLEKHKLKKDLKMNLVKIVFLIKTDYFLFYYLIYFLFSKIYINDLQQIK